MIFKLIRLFSVALLFVSTATFAQSKKPIVAIYSLEDLSGNDLSNQLTAMIETSISSTNKFRVMERERLGNLVGEQNLAKGGMVTTNNPEKTGGFEGVDYLVYGTITSINVKSQSDFGANFFASALTGNNNAGCNNSVATMELDIKITDANSGEVRYVKRISEQVKSETNCGERGSIDTGILLRTAADKVASGLVTTIYPIQVAMVQADGTLILNYGEGTLSVGQYLNIFSKGESIIDPATGDVLGSTETKLGIIKISEITGRMSKANYATKFDIAPAVGSIARPATDADIKTTGKNKKWQEE